MKCVDDFRLRFGKQELVPVVIGGMGVSIVLGLLYYGAMAVCVAMGKGGSLPPAASAWAAHVAFAAIGCWLIARTA